MGIHNNCKNVTNEFLELPVIKSFLSHHCYRSLFERALENPSLNNCQLLDREFKDYFTNIKMISYIEKLITGYTYDYKKKISRINRNEISASMTLDSEGGIEILNTLKGGCVYTDYNSMIEKKGELNELITNEKLSKLIEKLNPLEKKVIILIFVYQLKNNEVGNFLHISTSLVSYYKRKILKQLKGEMRC
ncbi:sigma factor-like helix-turn-helix DNA-binding protein [Halalkalibacter sp. APA_J-10(15)]|uniref:sigma factor-like helix-turn-helix DNA-binding protein n=1 Tax=Halalkalibacter sp. APA_J-10(15) TaxID=2933805 RepID=UPI001FF59E72|nr:sigma factor-like helix-turn-helix DNA-binding protein [Halalkalibacter sp. APA_J-10(15)]MCK0470276.1 hypothetical protein [Halalkalibacter sp. APA_J-10(15)]